MSSFTMAPLGSTSEATACTPRGFTPISPSDQDGGYVNYFAVREEEAREVLLTSTDSSEIKSVCLFFPFQNLSTLSKLLSQLSSTTLDNILGSLPPLPTEKRQSVRENDYCKVEDVLRHMGAKRPGPPIWNWEWSASLPMAPCNAAQIAGIIDSEISYMFYKVPFAELVRAACGCPTEIITDLLAGISAFRNNLQACFYELHQSKDKYESVEEILRSRSPLAYWVVSTALRCFDAVPDPFDALNAILGPIQDVFESKDLSVTQMLKRLAILSVIYYDKVVCEEDGKWESLLSADFCFLDRISIQSPGALAELITSEDEACFRKFSVELLDSKDFILRWAKLADNVKACCTVDRNLINPMGESVKHFLRLRNYYSATALLIGLSNASCHPESLSLFWSLVDSTNNYASYRLQWSKAPGLPFLQCHMYGNRLRKLADLFRFVEYFDWRYGHHEWTGDDLDSYVDEQNAHHNQQILGWVGAIASLRDRLLDLFNGGLVVVTSLLSTSRCWICNLSTRRRQSQLNIENSYVDAFSKEGMRR
ncbi:hypothetical protein HYALB_00002210 [Hymenoscyphus albidus]|uniref:Uncharacterized protein n=1 Tax=Hymenoscyphus albidus TaxID=595503 RepID=A0A9N9LJT5_9HELO|nr:hypothetical protein HYALB_00002210 [Hymenoscyphus albidus]